jgi:serralysin
MKPLRNALIPSLFLLLAPLSASATFHLWQITEVYSNADGSVQFVELFTNSGFQNQLLNHTLTSGSTTYTFPGPLLPTGTANKYLLIATPAFASQPGAVPPDFTLDAANFMSTVADTINFAGVDSWTYNTGELPTDGVNSLNEPFGSNVRTTAQNSPTNFAGQVGNLPEPSRDLALLAGAAALVGLAKLHHPRSRLGV